MHINILYKLWLSFCWHQQKIQKMSIFWHFKDYNLGRKHDKWQMMIDPIFTINSLRSICWYISFLHFKALKIQFHGVPNIPLNPQEVEFLEKFSSILFKLDLFFSHHSLAERGLIFWAFNKKKANSVLKYLPEWWSF